MEGKASPNVLSACSRALSGRGGFAGGGGSSEVIVAEDAIAVVVDPGKASSGFSADVGIAGTGSGFVLPLDGED